MLEMVNSRVFTCHLDTKEDDDTFYLTYKSGPDGD